jgi:hypothetical protein
MFEIPLNKFEKRDLVIKLHNEGHTYREICHMAHVSPRDIKPILKKSEQNIETIKRKEKKNRTKKHPSLGTQAFILYQEGKKIDEVKILLDIPFKKAMQFWVQYLKSIRMFEAFEFYQEHSYDIPTFLSIKTYMNRNNVSGNDILQVLREATDLINLRTEIERLKQIKNDYSLNQNTNSLPLLPLGLPKYYYNY